LFPVYLYEPILKSILKPSAYRAPIIPENELQPYYKALSTNCLRVHRCWAVFPNGDVIGFTGFFVSPHILLTAAHFTKPNLEGVNPVAFFMSPDQAYRPSTLWNIFKNFTLRLLTQEEPEPDKITETEPQGNFQVTPCDFVFFSR